MARSNADLRFLIYLLDASVSYGHYIAFFGNSTAGVRLYHDVGDFGDDQNEPVWFPIIRVSYTIHE